MKSRLLDSFVLLVFLTGLLVVQPSARAHAATVWTVTSNADGVANAANCPGAGCRLRDAIAAAVSGDSIVFGSGVTGTITLTGGELKIISQDITITGPGNAQLTIDGNNNGRIFGIYYGSTVSISGLTLKHGLANYTLYPPGTDNPAGGAILNSYNGHLTLDDMVIDHNTVSCGGSCTSNGTDGTGGGVTSSTGSSLTITNSSVTNNSAPWFGGGVFFNSGTAAGDDLTLTNVTLANNQATDPTHGEGGGLDLGNSHVTTLTNLTISHNTAAAAGGGLALGGPVITLTNSTFSSNQAQGTDDQSGGGGIYLAGTSTMLAADSTFTGNSSTYEGGAVRNNGATMIVYNSTFTGNSDAALGAGAGGGAVSEANGTLALINDTLSGNTAASTHGGALYNHYGTVTLQNTILANSTGGASDCASTTAWTSNVNNLMETNDAIYPCSSVGFSSDPLLGPLAGNGGPTQTMALLPGSPAIDEGSNSICANPARVNNKDQRGFTRPIDGDHNGSAICDIGAYEFNDTHAVSGSVGVSGVTLSYTDGTAKTVTSQTDGSYSLAVSSNWSGAVTPAHACYTFSPLNHSYSGVIADQTNQNYTPTIKAGCANVNVSVAGATQGIYGVQQKANSRQSYIGLNSGPVQVTGTNGTNIIASERIAYTPDGGTTWPSYSEMMGLPSGQVTSSYVMPWYNDLELNTQLRFGNVGTSATNVTVTIGGVLKGTYTLNPNTSQRLSYGGLSDGPVVISSSGGVPIIASQRVSYTPDSGTTWTYYSELMGLPSSQLTSSYVMPWYNNLDLNTQLRFGNVGNAATYVTVKIGGVAQGTYLLNPNQSQRISYTGLSSGPVQISSSGNVPIIASQRVAYSSDGGTTWPSFTELMGLPASQLTTSYVLPVYDNVNLNTQLRFGNVGNAATYVTVTIAGVVKGTYYLTPSQSQRISYAGLNDGPVQISSSAGVPIIASDRVAYSPDGGTTWPNFAEMMGLPSTQLTTAYVMPWYNNWDWNSQLRFAVP